MLNFCFNGNIKTDYFTISRNLRSARCPLFHQKVGKMRNSGRHQWRNCHLTVIFHPAARHSNPCQITTQPRKCCTHVAVVFWSFIGRKSAFLDAHQAISLSSMAEKLIISSRAACCKPCQVGRQYTQTAFHRIMKDSSTDLRFRLRAHNKCC